MVLLNSGLSREPRTGSVWRGATKCRAKIHTIEPQITSLDKCNINWMILETPVYPIYGVGVGGESHNQHVLAPRLYQLFTRNLSLASVCTRLLLPAFALNHIWLNAGPQGSIPWHGSRNWSFELRVSIPSGNSVGRPKWLNKHGSKHI